MKQTSIEWLIQEIQTKHDKSFIEFYGAEIEQAKEIEKLQSHSYAEFAIRCDRMDMKILNFEDFVKLETYNK